MYDCIGPMYDCIGPMYDCIAPMYDCAGPVYDCIAPIIALAHILKRADAIGPYGNVGPYAPNKSLDK
ncbi:hypothetical protein [Cytophaga hutchinsonii]|uniref:Uncharacterized protein n=1 Tax=Cytophaga hutchinsonii (strain ATCC 33406 / DSM 1761 / CIP 103989 / NBRC 15051 / NCIMB 9469 / D465) TaxID=269798 RepID=A0A6N4SNV1_CYTH3|nr:hypothetical protein [Cytophaga hutchinsonii]ABG57970.1 hypothetical protein CHU_0683 [Cytophaga hutchinsonii ATCC 33406]